ILCLVNVEKRKNLARAFGVFGAIGGAAGAYLLVTDYQERKKAQLEDEEFFDEFVKDLQEIPGKLETYLKKTGEIEALAKILYNKEQVFFIGRGLDSSISYEGSLKLKEISYINSFAIAAGELKHGTIALMEPGTLVLALATQDALYEKMISNIQEIKARGAHVLSVAKEGNQAIEMQSNEVIYIPYCRDEIAPLLSVVPLQLFSYYVAKERGCNIDKPKNLAKSVTVE
ncbi:MAG: SIS domain-containing protein, partial [Firmicutes bacterium]|nr:SIS domain-containing protein [Bacillota bacterium]